jgi:hypothetical protein
MKKLLYSLIFVVVIANSCNNSNSTKIDGVATCYSYNKNKDYVMLKITIIDNKVTGDLVYEYYEKDKNSGKINGVIKGDTLFADYTFMSEGLTSLREVAFLIKQNELVEGYGAVEEKEGKTIFKDKSTLEFNNTMVLKKIECNRKQN